MSDGLDALLRSDLLCPPTDFAQRVMQQLPPQPQPQPRRNRWQRLRWLATATGLIGGGLLGLSQLASFVFGLWIAASAI
jgi:hypothetical protein